MNISLQRMIIDHRTDTYVPGTNAYIGGKASKISSNVPKFRSNDQFRTINESCISKHIIKFSKIK